MNYFLVELPLVGTNGECTDGDSARQDKYGVVGKRNPKSWKTWWELPHTVVYGVHLKMNPGELPC